jgi:hypothetical protein
MNDFIILVFCLSTIIYLYYLYKKRIYVATMFWLGSFFISFLLPNLSEEKFGLGYIPNSKIFLQLNFYYLILLLTFIVANFFVTHLYLKRIKWPYLSLDYRVLNRVNIIYLIFSIPVLLIEKDALFKGGYSSDSPIEILKSITVFGLILSSLIKILYCKTKKQKIYSIIILVYAILFGIALSFARRFIIFPVIITIFFWFIINHKKPKIVNVVISLFLLLFFIMPLMTNIRTFGFIDGFKLYTELLFKNFEVYFDYLKMSTDVAWSYWLASIIIEKDIEIDPIILLKPLTIFIPRSIWENKPLPMSLQIARDLNLSDNTSLSVPAGIVGEAYGYFGIFGVMMWGWIWGAVTAYLDKEIQIKLNERDNSLNILILITLSIQIITGAIRGDIATTLIETEFIVFPFIIILLFSRFNYKI